jgi:hypothetical protein
VQVPVRVRVLVPALVQVRVRVLVLALVRAQVRASTLASCAPARSPCHPTPPPRYQVRSLLHTPQRSGFQLTHWLPSRTGAG